MYYYDGFKQGEIAQALDISVGTVKWHMHEASVKPIRFTGDRERNSDTGTRR
ncbi:RNA polymerase sigma factor [Cohnella yongneupensis]|uniref:RNA polymerase sigma factor n=2 Tax=Cohnella yongneupensis TaxID=425006 RepID=A0ABW0QTL4_9BACL